MMSAAVDGMHIMLYSFKSKACSISVYVVFLRKINGFKTMQPNLVFFLFYAVFSSLLLD